MFIYFFLCAEGKLFLYFFSCIISSLIQLSRKKILIFMVIEKKGRKSFPGNFLAALRCLLRLQKLWFFKTETLGRLRGREREQKNGMNSNSGNDARWCQVVFPERGSQSHGVRGVVCGSSAEPGATPPAPPGSRATLTRRSLGGMIASSSLPPLRHAAPRRHTKTGTAVLASLAVLPPRYCFPCRYSLLPSRLPPPSLAATLCRRRGLYRYPLCHRHQHASLTATLFPLLISFTATLLIY